MASPIDLNRRGLLWCLGGIVVVIYFAYSRLLPSYFATNKTSGAKTSEAESWKTQRFVEIPPQVKARMGKSSVAGKNVSFIMGDNRLQVFYRDSPPWDENEKCQIVVLLHGAGDSSEWWQKVGTFQLLSSAGYHVIGLDLPGWGQTKTHSVDNPGAFLAAFFLKLGIKQPVIVAASLGGMYALPYMMEPRASTCDSRLAGFVPVAIVGTNKYKASTYHRCTVPSMIVYGTKDTKLGLVSVGDLRNLANNQIYPMQDAGHACAREKPDEWHKLLYNFLLQAAPANKSL